MDKIGRVSLQGSSLINVFGVANYLQKSACLPKTSDIVALTGGTTNFTYRLFFQEPFVRNHIPRTTAIFKHATEYVASTPDVPFSRDRLVFDARALVEIPRRMKGLTDSRVRYPELYY